MGHQRALHAAIAGFLALNAGAALANPVGGTVVDGSAVIKNIGTTVRVEQGTNTAIVDWQSFNVAPGERVEFEQPSINSLTLNRVTGPGASLIEGAVEAPGRIFIINGDGVIFGDQARIDVNGLVASTMDISNDDFMAGDFDFNQPGAADASVINRGVITASDAGLVALVAPNVENSGVITARLGKVTLAAGEAFTLDFFGDGLVSFAATAASGAKTGGINVTGLIDAEAGAIYLTATQARDFVETVINVESDLVARSAAMAGGKIILSGGADSKITVSATLDASGVDGGAIEIAGGEVVIAESAQLMTDGAAASASAGDISVNSATRTDFAGTALARPGAGGAGGDIVLDSDGAVFFTGAADAGQAGSITLNGIISDGVTAFATPSAAGRKTVAGRLSEISETAGGAKQSEEEGGTEGEDVAVVIDGRGARAATTDGPSLSDQRLLCLHGVAPGACGASD